MIAGIFHQGSGLGNQLHRYVATRILARQNKYYFSMVAPELFKGKDFMNLDMGYQDVKFPLSGKVVTQNMGIPYNIEKVTGKVIPMSDMNLWQEKTNYYNPEFNFIENDTIIDGEFQSDQYFGEWMDEIDEWLKVEPIEIPDDVCIIGFRGGEFYLFPELGLPKEYFTKGIERMKAINPNMRFEVHTDDEILAKKFFPEYTVIHDIGINWRSMRYAKYAIIANSSFYILPRLLRHSQFPYDFIEKTITIAPRWWARHNTREWSRPDNYYEDFTYIHV